MRPRCAKRRRPWSECRFAREAGALRSLPGSGDAEDLCALERVGEDLQAADLVVTPIAPDVHDRQPLRPLALGHVGMTEYDDRVALFDELVGAQLELVPRSYGLLQHLDRGLLAL